MRLHALLDPDETIGVPSGMEVIYLRILESSGRLSSIQWSGMREKVHCSASGKALLAFLPQAVVAAKLSGYEFDRYIDRTILDAETFKAALNKVRDDGYAINDCEEYQQFLGISAPVFNFMGEPIAVLNIWSVHPHHTVRDSIGWASDLLASSRTATALIGGSVPD